MRKCLLLGSLVLGTCPLFAELYEYERTGSETIDGVAWSYCVSNNEARVVSLTTVGSYYYDRYDGGYWYDYDRNYSGWRSGLRNETPSSSYYYSSSYSSPSYYYYYSAIPGSTTGAIAVPSTLGGYPVVAVDAYAFGYCTGLTHVTIPEGVREIGPGAFYKCTGLATVVIPESVERIDLCAFLGCTALPKVRIPAAVDTVGERAFYGCTGLSELTLNAGLQRIDTYAFSSCSKLTRVAVPASVRTIADRAFVDCSGLQSAVLPEGVESIGSYSFAGCRGLASLTLPSTVTNLGTWAFSGCSGLTKAVVKAEVTALPDALFCDCAKLQSIVLPDWITRIAFSVFSGCAALTDISIPAGVTEIEGSAFRNCASLADVTLPQGLEKISEYAFYGCSKLRGIDLPYGIQSIGSYAFHGCASLTRVEIPNTVTLVNAGAFVGCTGIERILIPESIRTMASDAFACANASVVFAGDVPAYSVSDSGLLKSKAVNYSRRYGANWQKLLGTAKFGGYTETQIGLPEVTIVSARMRESDPTVLDVVYRVKCEDPTVCVRVLAFENGERSFANVILPRTFVDGTGANVGDGIAANAEHTVSWRVSADWSTDLSRMKFEVLAMRETYIPLELITIPAVEGHPEMTITWNTVTSLQVVNALYWLFADGDASLGVSNGYLRNMSNGITYMSGATLRNPAEALRHIYSRMGFSVLAGDNLAYARGATRLPLAADADSPFAIRND